MKKKVDPRVKTLIENNIKTRHRTLLVLVGDKGRDQVVNLYYILNKITTKKPSLLWCYKKDLGFSSHRKKRMNVIKKKMQRGQYDTQLEDPFELFVSTTNIRYCYYKQTQSILGQTFGMCVLQDFEALDPNNLCRTIETVEGGGIICLLLNSMNSLKQLYSITMDIHSKFRTESFDKIEPRFNERFILSLANCKGCLIMDDELNILPICKHANSIVPLEDNKLFNSENIINDEQILVGSGLSIFMTPNLKELKSIKNSAKDIHCLGDLIKCTVTVDQAKCITSLNGIISEKGSNIAVALTAGRGRGKSAALGLGIACAINYLYSNIVVTAPSPEMIGTVFLFVKKGLESLGMKEHSDFEIVYSRESLEQDLKDVVTQINIFKNHRQTVRYIKPEDYVSAKQAELLVIDEAAAIPLPVVKNLFGSGLIFISSTVNGYEGTGRALSIKLFNDLSQGNTIMANNNTGDSKSDQHISPKLLKKLTLKEPIRYSPEDPIENWLNELLCLDATNGPTLNSKVGLTSSSKCELFQVNRDALFSYHKSSEKFLHNLISLFVSSHYKNSPNDLALLSDAPAHQVFVLLPPIDETQQNIPDIYCAIQVCIEGNLSKSSMKENLGRGTKPSGDMLAWTLSQYFSDEDFGSLCGVRIVRIACHPQLMRMGYGSEAIKQLIKYYENTTETWDEQPKHQSDIENNSSVQNNSSKFDDSQNQQGLKTDLLHSESIQQRETQPLLSACSESSSKFKVHYYGTSFGVTLELYKFWHKLYFLPVYLRSSRTDATGENSMIMIKPSRNSNKEVSDSLWAEKFTSDFRLRFQQLLGYSFSHLNLKLALSIINPPATQSNSFVNQQAQPTESTPLPILDAESVKYLLSEHDIRRIKKYTQQLADHHFITDLLPTIGWLLFTKRFKNLTLSYHQCAVILAMACQRKSSEEAANELGIPHNQAMALFNKAIYKIHNHIQALIEKQAEKDLLKNGQLANQYSGATLVENGTLPNQSFTQELNDDAKIVNDELNEQRQELLRSMDNKLLKKYSMDGITEDDFQVELNGKSISGMVSIKRKNPHKNNTLSKANNKKDGFKVKKKSHSY